MLKSIIVDDELLGRKTLVKLLEKYCPTVEVIGLCENGKIALETLQNNQPDILFLDIEMPEMNGFEMIENLESYDFEIIFTTAYDEFALKAFQVCAIDYLLKPIDSAQLIKAVKKVEERKFQINSKAQVELLLTSMKSEQKIFPKLAIPSMEGIEFVDVVEIIRCEASKNYTLIFTTDGNKYVFSKTLKDIESLISSNFFFRIHQSHLINLNLVKKYIRGIGGYIIMADGSEIPVAKSKKSVLLQRIFNQ